MKTLFKELIRAVALGAVIFVILYIVVGSISNEGFPSGEMLFYFFFFTVLYTVVLYFVNYGVFLAMDRIFGKGRISPKRLITGVLASFVATGFFIFLLRVLEDIAIEGESFSEFIAGERISNYYFAGAITFTLLVHGLHFYRHYQENRVKKEKIIAGTASAQFETLKNQIDPHFLFNSLNVLSSLIEENPDSAQKFTTSLSKIYRYVLEQRDKELVSIQEELSFAKTYMNLLKMRFENSVFYEVSESFSNPDARVVPLSLQLLLENTIKHNVVSPQRPLYIKIYEEDGYLVIQNNLQKKEVLQDRKGVGLQNIVNRYGIITTRQVEVEQTEKYFTVRLPILTKQVAIMKTNYHDIEESSYYKAQKKVEEIKGFYGNLSSYVVIITGLAILNLITSPSHLWFFYPAIGWGIGVVIHGVSVFNYMPFLNKDWEDKKVREIMEKEKHNKWQ